MMDIAMAIREHKRVFTWRRVSGGYWTDGDLPRQPRENMLHVWKIDRRQLLDFQRCQLNAMRYW